MAAVDMLGGAWGSGDGGTPWWAKDDAGGPDLEAQTNTTQGGSSYTSQKDKSNINESKEDPLESAFAGDEDPDKYMGIYEAIKNDISKVESNRQEIFDLRSDYNASTQARENTDIMSKFEKITEMNTTLARQIQTRLKQEKENNDNYSKSHKGSSVAQWRINQLNSCTRRFKSATTDFSNELHEFENTLKNKQKRHIGILNTNNELSDEKIDQIVENPELAQDYIQQRFQMVNTSDAMLDKLAELEQRHQGMIRIEQGVKELQEMWNELHTLILEQQEMLDNIENNVNQTKGYVEQGVKHVQKAEEHQKCSRKAQLILVIIMAAVLLIIIAAFLPG